MNEYKKKIIEEIKSSIISQNEIHEDPDLNSRLPNALIDYMYKIIYIYIYIYIQIQKKPICIT